MGRILKARPIRRERDTARSNMKKTSFVIILGRAILRVFSLILLSIGMVALVPPDAAHADGPGPWTITYYDSNTDQPSQFVSNRVQSCTTSPYGVHCTGSATFHNPPGEAIYSFSVMIGSPTFWTADVVDLTVSRPMTIYSPGVVEMGTSRHWSSSPNGEFRISTSFSLKGGQNYTGDISWDLWITPDGTLPPPKNCSETFKDNTSLVDSLDIYPPVEFPQGPDAVSPALPDEMIVELMPEVVGMAQIYHLSTTGTWNDGTAERDDFAYSFDGIEFKPLEFLVEILCRDDTGWYFRTSEQWFYIRVNDTAGNFADNTPSEAPWPTYTLRTADQVQPLNCSDRYTYDPTPIYTGALSGNNSAPTIVSSFSVGEYYVLETSGTAWSEASADRYDIKVNSSSHTHTMASEISAWQYTSCSELTGEAQHKRYYFQAPTADFGLWVNSLTFAGSGSINFAIYHVTDITYWPSACESIYKINDLKFTQTYDSAAPNGNVVPPTNWQFWTSGQLDPVINGNNGAFELDQWFMMENTGLWADSNGVKFAATDWSDDSRQSWTTIQTWDQASCVVPLDQMGHYRVYWKFPDGKVVLPPTGYGVRADSPGGSFQGNQGSMTLKVYQVTNLQVTGIGSIPNPSACQGKYDTANHIIDAVVPPTVAPGIYIPSLIAGTTYSVSTSGYWKNNGSGGELTLADISDDNGVTWYAWNDYPGSLCFESFVSGTRAQLRLYFTALAGRAYKIRAADTDGNWSANTSGAPPDVFGISLYGATILMDPWNSCTANYTLTAIKTGEILYSHLGGAVPSDAPRLDIVPGELYSIEITSGEWFDAGDANPTLPKYDFQLSFDDGGTWSNWNDRAMPGYQCSTTYPQYGRVYFMAANANTYARIRVRDRDDPVDFTNNTGQLMYTIYAASTGGNPDITAYLPPVATVACYGFPTRPASALDVGAWIEYSRGSIQRFFLWCPEHTQALLAIMNDMKGVEPVATIRRVMNLQADVAVTIDSYDWQGGAPAIPFSGEGGGTDVASLIPDFSNSPFAGGQIEWTAPTVQTIGEGGGTDAPPGITSCNAHVTLTMGDSPLVTGFCSVMNILKMTGMNVAVNMAIVLASVLLFVRYLFKKWLQPLVAITTHSGGTA
jgi:hypothetical protein